MRPRSQRAITASTACGFSTRRSLPASDTLRGPSARGRKRQRRWALDREVQNTRRSGGWADGRCSIASKLVMGFGHRVYRNLRSSFGGNQSWRPKGYQRLAGEGASTRFETPSRCHVQREETVSQPRFL
jgi:hypothetical protein